MLTGRCCLLLQQGITTTMNNPLPLHVLPIDCSANPLTKASDDGRECVDRTCPAGHYDATSGELNCFLFDFEDVPAAEVSSSDLVNNVLCRPCPSDCTQCTKLEGDIIVAPGYGLSAADTTHNTSLRDIQGGRSLFKCPVPEACLGEISVDGVSVSSVTCAEGHFGPLCARCTSGWLQPSSEALCQLCPTTGVVWTQAIPIAIILPFAAVLRCLRQDFDASTQGKVLIGTVRLTHCMHSIFSSFANSPRCRLRITHLLLLLVLPFLLLRAVAVPDDHGVR